MILISDWLKIKMLISDWSRIKMQLSDWLPDSGARWGAGRAGMECWSSVVARDSGAPPPHASPPGTRCLRCWWCRAWDLCDSASSDTRCSTRWSAACSPASPGNPATTFYCHNPSQSPKSVSKGLWMTLFWCATTLVMIQVKINLWKLYKLAKITIFLLTSIA